MVFIAICWVLDLYVSNIYDFTPPNIGYKRMLTEQYRAGAHVVACECDQVMCQIASECFEENGAIVDFHRFLNCIAICY